MAEKFQLQDLRFTENKEIRTEEIKRRSDLLQDLGFSEESIQKIQRQFPTLDCTNNAAHSIEGLRQRGFTDPTKLIGSSSAIFGYAFENIDAKIEGLKQRGFIEPIKLITLVPSIFGYTFENIDAKIEGLKQRGFIDPIKLITSSPAVLGLAFENIDAKIEGLKQRGFIDPIKLITSLPTIFSYAFENIDAKIEDLKQRGFIDPIKLITSLPPILGLAPENIDRKLVFVNRIGNLLGLRQSGVQLSEYFPTFLGLKFDKTVISLRVLREYPDALSGINLSMVSRLLFSNIEDVLVAFSQRKKDERYVDFTKRLKEIKKQKMSKEEKQAIIVQELAEMKKITDRYKKAYMKEK